MLWAHIEEIADLLFENKRRLSGKSNFRNQLFLNWYAYFPIHTPKSYHVPFGFLDIVQSIVGGAYECLLPVAASE